MVGGRDFSHSQYQPRHPGQAPGRHRVSRRSCLRRGIREWRLPRHQGQGHPARQYPRHDQRHHRHPRRMGVRRHRNQLRRAISTARSALVMSRNGATVRLGSEVGLDKVTGIRPARRHPVGPQKREQNLPRQQRGHPAEMALAYSTFAGQGRRPSQLFLITKIEDHDRPRDLTLRRPPTPTRSRPPTNSPPIKCTAACTQALRGRPGRPRHHEIRTRRPPRRRESPAPTPISPTSGSPAIPPASPAPSGSGSTSRERSSKTPSATASPSRLVPRDQGRRNRLPGRTTSDPARRRRLEVCTARASAPPTVATTSAADRSTAASDGSAPSTANSSAPATTSPISATSHTPTGPTATPPTSPNPPHRRTHPHRRSQSRRRRRHRRCRRCHVAPVILGDLDPYQAVKSVRPRPQGPSRRRLRSHPRQTARLRPHARNASSKKKKAASTSNHQSRSTHQLAAVNRLQDEICKKSLAAAPLCVEYPSRAKQPGQRPDTLIGGPSDPNDRLFCPLDLFFDLPDGRSNPRPCLQRSGVSCGRKKRLMCALCVVETRTVPRASEMARGQFLLRLTRIITRDPSGSQSDS